MTALIRTGRLDRRVLLLRRGPSVDDGQTRVPGPWLALGWRSASVRARIGREPVVAGSRAGEATQSVWLRFDELTRTLSETDAVEIEGQHFEIVAPPIEVGRREGMELLVVAAGLEE
jgi:head-tail adaptor